MSFFCSIEANDEPMIGTAAHHTVWILLEYAGIWNNKAVIDNDLPAKVKAHLAQQLEAIPEARLLFIKQRQRANTPNIRLFVADLGGAEPVLYRFELGGYDEVAGVNIPGIINGSEDASAHRYHDPLYLICTNGKRDLCCAKFGLPVYQAFSDQVGDQAWETTHIGGHRYAPTLLTFPHGVCYGRVDPADVGDVIRAENKGQTLPQFMRGQVAFPAEAQAGFHFLQEQTGDLSLGAWRWCGTDVVGELGYEVRFVGGNAGISHTIKLQRENIPAPNPVGCNGKVKPVPRFTRLP